jgi:hypothetical protein
MSNLKRMNLSKTWFEFVDQRTGVKGPKTSYDVIFVFASSRRAAIAVFWDTLKVNPECKSCGCCGADFSIYGHSRGDAEPDKRRPGKKVLEIT